MLFRMLNMFCTFTLVLSEVCVQCPTPLLFVGPWFRAFPVCYSGIVSVILWWFHLSLLLLVPLFPIIIIIIIIIITIIGTYAVKSAR
jgi:hypothetical protein